MGAVFVQRLGHSAAAVAAFMAATILGGALFQWPIGYLSDRYDRRRALFAVCASAAVIAAGASEVVQFAPAALIPAGIVLGGLLFAIYGLSVAHVNDLIEPSRVLEVTGGLLLVHGIGASLGPTLAGIVMNALGTGSFLIYFAAVTALQALYTLRGIRVTAPVPSEAKAGYVSVAGSSQAALQLDPQATAVQRD